MIKHVDIWEESEKKEKRFRSRETEMKIERERERKKNKNIKGKTLRFPNQWKLNQIAQIDNKNQQ